MMKIKLTIVASAVLILSSFSALAGNENRSGSAAGTQLLINPWAKSSGLMSSNMAGVKGLESVFMNVAGLSFIKKTELSYTYSQYLVGSGIGLNTIAFGQKLGDANVISLSVMMMNYGEVDITTYDTPEGEIGTYSPRASNFALSYARSFSNAIHGGVTVRVLNENISNVKASGIAFDAGIKYVAGMEEQFQFGISLKNFGPPMTFDGDGLFVTAEIVETEATRNLRHTTEGYEIPALMGMGGSYDFNFGENHRFTSNIAFLSNSFSRDQFNFGGEYALKEQFILRAGYSLERTTVEDAVSASAFTGLGFGASLRLPMQGTDIMLDYSYRDTNPFSGVHSIGVSISLK